MLGPMVKKTAKTTNTTNVFNKNEMFFSSKSLKEIFGYFVLMKKFKTLKTIIARKIPATTSVIKWAPTITLLKAISNPKI